MEPFKTLSGVAAPLPMINVDTDMIIPKQFLKTIKRTGLGSALFHEMRTNADGSPNPGFRAEQAGLQEGADPGRRRQFRLRLDPRACALGAARFRHPLRDRAELRGHLLQQLLQERHSADRAAAGADRQAAWTMPSAAPTRSSRSISRNRKSAVPMAAASSSTSIRSASNAC